jgi:hypothetical protein
VQRRLQHRPTARARGLQKPQAMGAGGDEPGAPATRARPPPRAPGTRPGWPTRARRSGAACPARARTRRLRTPPRCPGRPPRCPCGWALRARAPVAKACRAWATAHASGFASSNPAWKCCRQEPGLPAGSRRATVLRSQEDAELPRACSGRSAAETAPGLHPCIKAAGEPRWRPAGSRPGVQRSHRA